VVVWLYAAQIDAFPRRARRLLEDEPLAISPMVELELDSLHEIGRTTVGAAAVLDELSRTIGLTMSSAPFADVVASATHLTWTRDPFDRLICAQAVTEDQTLLTKDRTIRRNLRAAARE
jgi:PIN domain nuclease of toxin-antitoxin system